MVSRSPAAVASGDTAVVEPVETTSPYDKILAYRSQLVSEVHSQISALNTSLTPVHLVLKHVVKFQNEKSFDCLTDEDVMNLSKYIAPLVFSITTRNFWRVVNHFFCKNLWSFSETPDIIKEKAQPKLRLVFIQCVNALMGTAA